MNIKLIILLLVSSTLLSQDKYIHAGKIYDSYLGKFESNKTIIISDNIISSVEDGFIEPKNNNIELYDLKNKVLIPGLIDFHVHIYHCQNLNNLHLCLQLKGRF